MQNDYTQLVQLVSRTWRYMWLRDRFNELVPWLTAAYAARDTLEPALRGELCRLWGVGLLPGREVRGGARRQSKRRCDCSRRPARTTGRRGRERC